MEVSFGQFVGAEGLRLRGQSIFDDTSTDRVVH